MKLTLAVTQFNRMSFLHNSALRFSIRVTVSALIAFSFIQFVAVPLHGLWAVLTSVVVLQASVGASIRATVEYVLGTFAGAIYASVLSILIPHETPLAMAAVLALAIAPLGYLAAHNSVFRVAPFTAVIVLLLAGQLGEKPFAAALTRLLEVAFGGAVAFGVSLFVFPERAHGLGRRQAAQALRGLAHALPEFLLGFGTKADPEAVLKLQDELGASVAACAATIAEAEHERYFRVGSFEDPGAPLSRTLLRLRHDFVIIGRAAADPLPPVLGERLMPLIVETGSSIGTFLACCAAALDARRGPSPLEAVYISLDACAREIGEIRREGLTRALPESKVEQLFAFGFALEQLRANLGDLSRCIHDWSRL